MALTVQAGGKTFTFPDNTSQADIEEAVNTNVGTTQTDYQNYVIEAAKQRGLPLDMVMGMLNNESSGADPKHFVGGKIEGSTERAQGPLQIRPSTAADLGYNPEEVIRDPRVATDAALDYAKQNYEKFGGDKVKTLKSHFGGPGNADSTNPNIQSYADRAMAYGSQWLNTATQNNNPQVVSQPSQAGSQQPQQPQAGQPTAAPAAAPTGAPTTPREALTALGIDINNPASTRPTVAPLRVDQPTWNTSMVPPGEDVMGKPANAAAPHGTQVPFYEPSNPYVAPPAITTAGFNPASIPAGEDVMGKPPIAAAGSGTTQDINAPLRELGRAYVSGAENTIAGAGRFVDAITPDVGKRLGLEHNLTDYPLLWAAQAGHAMGIDTVGQKTGQAVGKAIYGDNGLGYSASQSPAFQPLPTEAGADVHPKNVESPETTTGKVVEGTVPFLVPIPGTGATGPARETGMRMMEGLSENAPRVSEYLQQHQRLNRIVQGAMGSGQNVVRQVPSNVLGAAANVQPEEGETNQQWLHRVGSEASTNIGIGIAGDALMFGAKRLLSPRDWALTRLNSDSAEARQAASAMEQNQQAYNDLAQAHADNLNTHVEPMKAERQAAARKEVQARALDRQADAKLAGFSANDLDRPMTADELQGVQLKQQANALKQEVETHRAVADEHKAAIDQTGIPLKTMENDLEHQAQQFQNNYGHLSSTNATEVPGVNGSELRGASTTQGQFQTELEALSDRAGRPLTAGEKEEYIRMRQRGETFIPENEHHPFNDMQSESYDIPRNEGESFGAYQVRRMREIGQGALNDLRSSRVVGEGAGYPIGGTRWQRDNAAADAEALNERRGPMDTGRKQPLGILDNIADRARTAQAMNRNGAEAGITEILKDPTFAPEAQRFLKASGINAGYIERFSNPKGGWKAMAEFFGVKNPELAANRAKAGRAIMANFDTNIEKAYGLDTGKEVLNRHVAEGTEHTIGVNPDIAGLGGEKAHEYGAQVQEAVKALKRGEHNRVSEIVGNLRQKLARDAQELPTLTGTGYTRGAEGEGVNKTYAGINKVQHDLNAIDSLSHFIRNGEQGEGVVGGIKQNTYGTGQALTMMALWKAMSMSSAAATLGAVFALKKAVGRIRKAGADELYDALYGRYQAGWAGREQLYSPEYKAARSSYKKAIHNVNDQEEQDQKNNEADAARFAAATNPDNMRPVEPWQLADTPLVNTAKQAGLSEKQVIDWLNKHPAVLRKMAEQGSTVNKATKGRYTGKETPKTQNRGWR